MAKRKAEEQGVEICLGCNGSFSRMSVHLSRRPRCRQAFHLGRDVKSENAMLSAGMGSVIERSFQTVMRATIVNDLSDFRFGRQKSIVSGSVVDGFKERMSSWMASVEASLVDTLRPHVSPESGIDVSQLIHSRLDIFNGIHTAKLEQRALVDNILGGRFVEPRRRLMPGSHTDCVWDFPLIEQLQATITYDPSAAAQILESSEKWSKVSTPPTLHTRKRTWVDVPCGNVFQLHSKLGAAAGPMPCFLSGADGVKSGWKGYYDDVESTNPLGVARGVHSIGAIYVCNLNLDAETRNRLEKVFLVTLALTSVIRKYGMLAVLAGALSDGSLDPTAIFSLGGQMRMLDAGVALKYPVNGSFGGTCERTTYGWTVMMSADYPAAAKMLCTSQSTSSKKPCRNCDWEKDDGAAYAASSFVERRNVRARWKLRTLEETQGIIDAAQLLASKTQRENAMRLDGIYHARYAFHPLYFPCLSDSFASSPQDGMHNLFSSGVANKGMAEKLYVLISVHKDFSLDQVNDGIELHDGWGHGEKPPAIHSSVLQVYMCLFVLDILICTTTYTHTHTHTHMCSCTHVLMYSCTHVLILALTLILTLACTSLMPIRGQQAECQHTMRPCATQDRKLCILSCIAAQYLNRSLVQVLSPAQSGNPT